MKVVLFFALCALAASANEDQVLQEFAAGNVPYIANIYKELSKFETENFVVSPLSIQTVFALINGAARGSTAKQITDGLHLPEDDQTIRQIFHKLSVKTNDQYTLSSANKIYMANYFNINKQYKSNVMDVFDSEIQNIDFTKTFEAVSEINKWVEEQTHGKIKDLVNEEIVSADTITVLVNALYFQGKWVKQFVDVLPSYFYIGKKNSIITDMMFAADHFNYYNSPELNAKFLELPYEGNDVTMTFVLPNDIEGLSALEARIADVLTPPSYRSEFISIEIPRFKIATTINLIPILHTLGITDAFTSSANFSGLGENEESILRISAVVQKAFIEVDEKGTTAAAATAISGDRISGGPEEPNFTADHPFIFYLKHKVYGVFFIGRFSVAENSTLV